MIKEAHGLLELTFTKASHDFRLAPGETYARAKFEYTAEENPEDEDEEDYEPELSFAKDHTLVITDHSDADWYHGYLIDEHGKPGPTGAIPANYVELGQMGSDLEQGDDEDELQQKIKGLEAAYMSGALDEMAFEQAREHILANISHTDDASVKQSKTRITDTAIFTSIWFPHLQFAAHTFVLPFRWPGFIEQTASYGVALFSLDFGLLASPECLDVTDNPRQLFAGKFVMTHLAYLAFNGILRVPKICGAGSRLHSTNAIIAVYCFSVAPLVKSCIRTIDCTIQDQYDPPTYTLNSFPDIECWAEDVLGNISFWIMATVGIIGIIVYGIYVPIHLYLRVKRERMKGKQLRLLGRATVREAADIYSEKIGELKKGDRVIVFDEVEDGGHIRVCIGADGDEWITRVTESGKVMAHQTEKLEDDDFAPMFTQRMGWLMLRFRRSRWWAEFPLLAYRVFVICASELMNDTDARSEGLLETLVWAALLLLVWITIDTPYRDSEGHEGMTRADKLQILVILAQLATYVIGWWCLTTQRNREDEGHALDEDTGSYLTRDEEHKVFQAAVLIVLIPLIPPLTCGGKHAKKKVEKKKTQAKANMPGTPEYYKKQKEKEDKKKKEPKKEDKGAKKVAKKAAKVTADVSKKGAKKAAKQAAKVKDAVPNKIPGSKKLEHLDDMNDMDHNGYMSNPIVEDMEVQSDEEDSDPPGLLDPTTGEPPHDGPKTLTKAMRQTKAAAAFRTMAEITSDVAKKKKPEAEVQQKPGKEKEAKNDKAARAKADHAQRTAAQDAEFYAKKREEKEAKKKAEKEAAKLAKQEAKAAKAAGGGKAAGTNGKAGNGKARNGKVEPKNSDIVDPTADSPGDTIAMSNPIQDEEEEKGGRNGSSAAVPAPAPAPAPGVEDKSTE